MAVKENNQCYINISSKRKFVDDFPKFSQNESKKRLALINLTNLPCTVHSILNFKPSNAPRDNPQTCKSRDLKIEEYLHVTERNRRDRIAADYMEKVQTDVTPVMRGKLVDWLVEVADEYKLQSETLYLAVNCIDRFLSSVGIKRQKFQLLGVTSMLIASKYEEISPPNVADFCDITDNSYSKDEMVKMEAAVLKALKFELGNPTVKTFLGNITRAASAGFKEFDLQLEPLVCYIAELSLLDYECLKFLPSLVAASAAFLARFILQPSTCPWNSELEVYSGYKASELKSCVFVLYGRFFMRTAPDLSAIRVKYSECARVLAAIMPPNFIPEYYFF